MNRAAASALGLALLALSTPRAGAEPPGVLTVRVVGLRSNAGQVGCTLYDSPRGFPTDASLALARHFCAIEGRASTCPFGPLPEGTYAVACFHDENKNGLLDRGLFGIPTEGTVASNQAKGFMGPPSFEKAKFRFAGLHADLPLRMDY